MKQFWALPAFTRLAIASHHTFNIQNDLLAFPQYEIIFPTQFVTEEYASSRLAASSTPTPPTSQETQELSKPLKNGPDSSLHDATEDDITYTYESMVLHGQRYLCRIPVVELPDANSTTASAAADENKQSPDEEEKELMRATDRGWELLQPMQDNCFYFSHGWWSYSFCYNSEIKQFHSLPPSKGVPVYPPVEDLDVPSYVLGRFPEARKKGASSRPDREREESGSRRAGAGSGGENELARLATKGETRYMVQELGGGTRCDLTGKERKIEVQFHCEQGSSDRIAMIKEVSTCTYLMLVHTPRLCNDVAFLPPQEDEPNLIACEAIVADDKIAAWTKRLAHEAQQRQAEKENNVLIPALNNGQQQQAHQQQKQQTNPIVGGIEVAAKKLVGTDGKMIEKSVVVGGGKEVFLATVANSKGALMSASDMKKYKIDAKDVEKWKKAVVKEAKGNAWQLDIYDTPKGPEFRGLIETEKTGASGSGSSKNNKGADGGAGAGAGEDDEEVGSGDRKKQRGAAGTGSGSDGGNSNANTKDRVKGRERERERERERGRERGQDEGTEEVYKDEL